MEEQYFNMEKNLTANTDSVFAPSRFAYIDIAKALGILMVVFAHINVEGGIYRTFYRIISAFSMQEEKVSGKILFALTLKQLRRVL